MINVSNEFKYNMANDNRRFLPYLDITLKDGMVLDALDASDIWESGFKVDDGVTASGEFTIGSCIINKLTVTLNNIYDKFSAYDFDRAIVTAYLGMELTDGRVERIRKGVFTVDEPKYNGAVITLECLDNMYKLDRDYSEVNTAYPATIGRIVRDICELCGIVLLTTTFEGSNIVVQKRPDDEGLSCRHVLSYAAQRACRFARCDVYGRMALNWFEQTVFERSDRLDGGSFDEDNPYSSGDVADGGTFNPWTQGYETDSGTFEDQNGFHHLYSMSSLDVSTDDVVITGVEVTEEFDETDIRKKDVSLYGAEGYILSISGNPFIGAGEAGAAAEFLGKKLVGLQFRPMSGSFLGDPTIEAGDLAYVTDYKQNTYHCLVTNLTFTLGNYMQVSCDAETPRKNSAKKYSELTRVIAKMRKETQAQLSSYDIAVQQMNQLAANTFGYHFTVVKQDDGSIISYQHDKPTLAESKVVYKKGIDGFFVTRNYTGNDSTTVWTSGFDSSGNAVLNILNAIGINFGWARGGTLTLGGKNNGNGVLQVLDSNGNLKAQLDMVSFNVNGGNIILNMDGSFIAKKATIYGDGEFSGNLKAATGTFKGELQAATGSFSGEVNADSGKVGGWVIKNNYIQSKNETITLYSNGLIEIGSVILSSSGKAMTAKYGLHVYAGTDQFSDGSDSIKFFNLPHVTNGGHLVFGSDGSTVCYSSSSSLRYKSVGKKVTSEDVEPLYTLPVNWAKYKEGYLSGDDERDGTYYPMFIAEEVHNHFPLAADHKNGKPENWNHRILIPCMMKMLQDQKKRNDEQDKTISELKDRISRLEERIGGGTNGNPKQERTL